VCTNLGPANLAPHQHNVPMPNQGSAEPAFRNCLKFCCDIPSFFKDGAEIQVGPLGRTGTDCLGLLPAIAHSDLAKPRFLQSHSTAKTINTH
jgi:hypothetical protein